MTFEEKQKEIEAGWDKQSAEKKEEETNKYLEDMEWGHRMGFQLKDRVKAAEEILTTLGYSTVEVWKDKSKK